MDELLFRIIAVSATAGFAIGVLRGWLPMLLVSLVLAALFVWLTRNAR